MKWILYGDHKMDPLRRSWNGSYTPVGDIVEDEEHVLLVLAADLALGGKDLAHEFVQALLVSPTGV
jgi:hypothetical protein